MSLRDHVPLSGLLVSRAFAKRAFYKLEFVVSISSREKVTLVSKQFIIRVPFRMASIVIIEILRSAIYQDMRYILDSERSGEMSLVNVKISWAFRCPRKREEKVIGKP